ncbi:NADP-binding protein [Dacryopinax primogenitus]|uniref:NADP-binding protein n=1 Tax=Dacryopinax primogenitus (strain DJM 731) TaxID=1858805 RepID=M5FVJ4_DACPD|nr:NADP-binding protein [Dacryopinax primogenitus]EJT97356.1 NADP-binding protein [Dacryopinax primogenitus]
MSIPPLPPNTTLQGRSFLITGANVGLGFAAARLALQLGASPVYITTRTAKKGDKARDELLADPEVKKKNPNAIVKVYEVEMSKWDSVTSFAKKFLDDRKTAGEGLDIAILNAGLVNGRFVLAPTGNEMDVQVNHLSTAPLALLLLPLLERSTTPEHTARLTIISSMAHLRARLTPQDDIGYLPSLNDKKSFSPVLQYSLSKLLIILFLRELCEKVTSDKVIIWSRQSGLAICTARSSPEKGAITYIDAVANIGKESHGLWYQKTRLTPYSKVVTGPEGKKLQKRSWDETLKQLEQVSPGVDPDL